MPHDQATPDLLHDTQRNAGRAPSDGWEAARVTQLDELVRDALAGDRSAFACLLEREAQPVYRATLSILGSPEDARDAVQEAAIRAWQQLPKLRNSAAWPAWFRRIAVRTALDESRRARRSREVQLPDQVDGELSHPMPHRDEMLTVLAALSRLPAEDRALLGLRYGADLTVPDSAEALGIRLGTAKARLHRALKKLRTELGDDCG